MITIRSAKVTTLPAGGFFDCRKLKNPHHHPILRKSDGRDMAVREYVLEDSEAMNLLRHTTIVAPQHGEVVFGCVGGRHRSVAMAEALRENLTRLGHEVQVIHHELEAA